jgi:Mg2+ and Co2+ transporter CorA
MSDMSDILTRARGDAQALHQKIEAARTKNHEAVRTDLQQAGAKAQQLAGSLKTAAESQRNDARQHLKSAASQLEDAGKRASDLGHATQSQINDENTAMLGKVRGAIQNISHAIASQGASTAKVS